MENIRSKLKFSNSTIQGLSYYILSFFIFSFLGWVIETIFCYIVLGELVKRGFLYTCICPIYGIGALTLIYYLDRKKNIKLNYFKLFIQFTIIFSFFEYLVGFILDALFASTWWDYSTSTFNLNGRITVLNSFFWGVMTLLFTIIIYPLSKKFKLKILSKIPLHFQIIICLILCGELIVDLVLSCIKYLTQIH